MTAKVIAFLNCKGGVGKTAGTVNLAASLAKYHYKRILVVDLDPQCNSSFWLCSPHACRQHTQNGKNSSVQIFFDQVRGSHHFDFESAVIKGVPRIDGYHLLPARKNIFCRLSGNVAAKRSLKRWPRLAKSLEKPKVPGLPFPKKKKNFALNSIVSAVWMTSNWHSNCNKRGIHPMAAQSRAKQLALQKHYENHSSL